MPAVWIVHRHARARAALARLADLGPDARVGAPGDPAFEGGDTPQIVVLGLADDLEAELEFAHRKMARHPGARWLLVVDAGDRGEAERLFDTLSVDLLVYPPRREELRARIGAALRVRPAHSLAERQRRDALTARFVRYFGDLELPELLRALDPGAARLPLVIRGEPGTGRALLARYVHAVAGSGPLLWVPGRTTRSAEALDAALTGPTRGPFAICVEDADALAPDLQHRLMRWIELGPPGPAAREPQRWISTLGDIAPDAWNDAPQAGLLQALTGIQVRIPPLREREAAIPRIATDWLAEWSRRHGRPPRELSEDACAALCVEPWPDNLRELEAVLTAGIAAAGDGPLDAGSLGLPVPAGERSPDLSSARPVEPPRSAAAPPSGQSPADASQRPTDAPMRPHPVSTPIPRTEPPDDDLPRFAGVLAHEIRNPLATIRTFASLLPDHAEDPEFRERFRSTVEGDVDRIESALGQLADFADFTAPGDESVDVTALLEEALEERRSGIAARRLVVLKELEREHPRVGGDSRQLAFALELLIDHALEQLPERGDLYLASKHLPVGTHGSGSLRILLRFDCAAGASEAPIDPAAAQALGPRETSLDLLLAERVVRAHGGELACDESAAQERLIVVELPGE